MISHRWFALTLALLAISFIPQIPYQWHDQLSLGFLITSILVVSHYFKEYHFSFRLLLSYICTNVFMYSMKHDNIYNAINPLFATVVDGLVLHSFSIIIICAFAIQALMQNHAISIRIVMVIASFIGSILLIVKPFIYGYQTAFLNNPSMDATFLAILYPNFLRIVGRVYWPLCIVPAAAIISTRSSMGIVCLCVAFTAYFLHKHFTPRRAVLIAGVVIQIVSVQYLLMNWQMWDFNGRLGLWEVVHKYWVENVDKWIGSGLSTFHYFGPMIQKKYNFDLIKNRWFWMHSDWLQSIFELGFVGFAICLYAWVCGVIRSFKREGWVFASLLTMFVACLAQMPWRFFQSGFVCGFILMISLKADPKWQWQPRQ